MSEKISTPGIDGIREHILRACRAYQAKGGVVVAKPTGVEGELCPMQAVAVENLGDFGLMPFPWEYGPAKILGITPAQVWNFICGFDFLPPGTYTMTGTLDDGVPSEPEFYALGNKIREELGLQ